MHRDHQPRYSAYQEIDAHEGADRPCRVRGPASPNHEAEHKGHQSIDKKPKGAANMTDYQVRGKFENAFDQKETAQQQRQRSDCNSGENEQVAAKPNVNESDNCLKPNALQMTMMNCVNHVQQARYEDHPGNEYS